MAFERRVLRDRVIDYLLEGLSRKRYLPGDRIAENHVAVELGISKGAVREAFRDLEGQGVLTSQPFRGTRLRTFSARDLKGYFRARSEFARISIEIALKELGGRFLDLGVMERFVEQMVFFAHSGEEGRQVEADVEFHRTLVRGTDNDALLHAWNALGHYFWISLGLRCRDILMVSQAAKHMLIVERLRQGDGKGALAAIEDHFRESRDFFLGKEGVLLPRKSDDRA